MKLTLEQLKAAAYDLIANIEVMQGQLRQVNEQIANYQEEPVEPKKKK